MGDILCRVQHPALSMILDDGTPDGDTLTCPCARLVNHEGDHAGYFFSTKQLEQWPNDSPHDLDVPAEVAPFGDTFSGFSGFSGE